MAHHHVQPMESSGSTHMGRSGASTSHHPHPMPPPSGHRSAGGVTTLTDFLHQHGSGVSTKKVRHLLTGDFSRQPRAVAAAPSSSPSHTWSSSQVPVNRHTEKHLQMMLRHRTNVEETKSSRSSTARLFGSTMSPRDRSSTVSTENNPNPYPEAPQGSLTSRPAIRQNRGSGRERPTVTIFSADDEWQATVSIDVAARAGTLRQMLQSGNFLENLQGEVRFPTIRAVMLQETTACLESLSSNSFTSYQPFGGAGSTSELIELLMVGHFLDIPELMQAAARVLAGRFLELPPLRQFPDEVLQLIVQHLPAHFLYVAERKLWKQHRRLHTRAIWHQLFEQQFRMASAPSTLGARRLCLQQFLEDFASRCGLTPVTAAAAAGGAGAGAASSSLSSFPPSLLHSRSSLELVSPRSSPAVMPSPRGPHRAAVETNTNVTTWPELANWLSFLGAEQTSFQLRNAQLESRLSDILYLLPSLRLLDLSSGGYEKGIGSSLAKGLNASHRILVGLDLTRCHLSPEGLRAIGPLLVEPSLAARRRASEEEMGGPRDALTASTKQPQLDRSTAAAASLTVFSPRATSADSCVSHASADSPLASASSSPTSATPREACFTFPPLGLLDAPVDVAVRSTAHLSSRFRLTLPIALPTVPPPPSQVRPGVATSRQHSTSTNLFVSHLHRSLSTAALEHFMPTVVTDAIDGATPPRVTTERRDGAALMQADFHAAAAQPRKHKKDRVRSSDPADAEEIEVTLRDNSLGDAGATMLAQSLSHSRIRWLDLTGNMLGEKSGGILGEWIRRSNSLTHLHVGHCSLGSRGVASLVDGIHQASEVQAGAFQLLDIQSNIKPGEENHATSSLYHWLTDLLAVRSLAHLFLGGNSWPPSPFASVLSAALSLPGLLALDCSAIDMQGASDLPMVTCSTLRQHRHQTRLRTLSMANNRMSTENTSHFAEMLAENETLTSLDLGGNHFNAYGAAAFGAALSHNHTLSALGLAGFTDGCRIRAEGCVALMRGLTTNRSLTSLDLSHHGLRNAGCLAVREALMQSHLRYINLQRNHIQQRGAKEIASGISSLPFCPPADRAHPELVLDLSCNGIDGPGVEALQAATRTLLRRRMEDGSDDERAAAAAAPVHVRSSSPPPACSTCRTLSTTSVWVCPHLRAPAYSRRLTQHSAAQLKAIGCVRQIKQAIQILVQQQVTARQMEGSGPGDTEEQ